ncbi:putative reverse transcriptase domain-containing protein [Tanacetum coccineum]
MKRVNTFVDYRTELVEESSKKADVEIAQESISKRAGDELEQESSKKQKLEEDKESEELKQCLEIIPDDGDDVTIDATPLSTKSPTIVDYKIYQEGKKNFFQIIRADGKHQMYLTFGKMLKNFDREDLEVLWSIVKARFKKTKPVNYMDNFLLLNLKTMFEHHVKDNMYPLTKHTPHQMFNDVKLQVDYECEMAFELLRLGRIVRIKSLLEVTVAKLMLLVYKLLLLVLEVNAASINVTTAQRLRLLKEFLLKTQGTLGQRFQSTKPIALGGTGVVREKEGCSLVNALMIYLSTLRIQKEHVEHLVQFLGHVINGNGIHVDPSKIEAVRTRLRVDAESQKDLNMRQHRWIELFSDYDCEIRYHPGKANVVADDLSRKERVKPKRVRAMNMTPKSSIKDRIQVAQKEAVDEFAGLQKGLDEMIEQRSDGALYYLDRIWVPLKGDERTLIMDETHKSKYSVHPGADKMYYDLRDRYWWPGIKKDIAMYVRIAMDFVTKLPRTSYEHDTIWVIMDRLTKSAHFLPMREDYKMDRLARLYLNEIVARHGVLI